MTEREFAKKINAAGGKAYLVGGAVRDKFRGVAAHDRDYCVTGLDEKIFNEIFDDAPKFGKSFPVYAVEIDGDHCEVAFARTERKVGAGYRGFEVLFSPDVTIEQDLYRRDTTINAMAIELLSGELGARTFSIKKSGRYRNILRTTLSEHCGRRGRRLNSILKSARRRLRQ